MNRKSMVFLCFSIILASFVEAQVTGYGYVERDPNYTMDWSKVGQDISKTFNDAALARQEQYSQCVELTNQIQGIILKTNFQSKNQMISLLANEIHSLTYKYLDNHRKFLQETKSANFSSYKIGLNNLVNNSVFINKQLYDLDLFYFNQKEEILNKSQNIAKFNAFDSLFKLTLSSIYVQSVDKEGYHFKLNNLIFNSSENLTMYSLFGFVVSSANGRFEEYKDAYKAKIEKQRDEARKLESEILTLKNFVGYRSNYISNLNKEYRKKYLKKEVQWLKNYTQTTGINKKFIVNLVSKNPKSWNLNERQMIFSLKKFYENEVSTFK